MAAEFLRRFVGTRHHPGGRQEMLARLRPGGVTDPRVLAAMATVRREEFVAEGCETVAYADRALPIGYGQTISQPLMVALVVQALELREGDRVLDVGTGSGYQAAVIAACGARVVGVERVPALASSARIRLRRLGMDIDVVTGDGSAALVAGPFDAVAVGAAAPRPPVSLLESLSLGGRLVVPLRVGRSCESGERLVRFRCEGTEWLRRYFDEDLGPCRFVPLIGAEGFDAEGA